MNENKLVFQDFLRSRIHSYRNVHAFSQEHMAEALRISPRSYIDQEHGKYGFSAMTLVYYIFLLNDEEILTFIGELRYLMGRRKEDVAESHV